MPEPDGLIERLATLDPRKIDKDAFVALVRESRDDDLARLDAQAFARLIAWASRAQIGAVLADPGLRERVLDEIFRRMGDHLRADRTAHVSAVVHWRLTGGSGEGGFDRFETIIDRGTCVVHREPTREPRATITLHPHDFVKLATH